MTVQALKEAYERVIEPVDPVAVIVTCASGVDKAGCLVTFSAPCSIDPEGDRHLLGDAVVVTRARFDAGVEEL